jgi:GntR family transcriptional regulator
VTPFTITIQPGVPISDQIVYAAKRAIIAGHMRPGDAFPSVRALSVEMPATTIFLENYIGSINVR